MLTTIKARSRYFLGIGPSGESTVTMRPANPFRDGPPVMVWASAVISPARLQRHLVKA